MAKVNTKDVQDILESQEMIDKIIVKNSDDILKIKKTKEENIVAFKHLERQIEKRDEELELAKQTIEIKRERAKERLKDNPANSIECKMCEENFENCPYEELGCKFLHIAAKNCEFGRKCKRRLCPDRHEVVMKAKNEIDDIHDDIENSEVDEIKNSESEIDSFVTSTPIRENLNVKNVQMKHRVQTVM